MDPRALRAELLRLRDRWLRLALIYGACRIALAAGLFLAAVYALDRTLTLPVAVRLLFAAGGVAGACWLLFRGILYPLRKAPGERDVACAVERRYPEFDGRLLAALELEGEALDPSRNVSTALVDRLREQVAALREGVRLDAIFERRPLRRIAAAAAVVLLLEAGFAAWRPELASIFGRRLVGSAARWPQETMLRVEFPDLGAHFEVDRAGDRPVRVRIARGASLPVTVLVTGRDPESVTLATEGAPQFGDVSLAPTAEREWVGRFRAVRDAFRFQPVGGDDDGGGREIDVEVFAPPAVAGLVTELAFPAYTGLERRREPRGDVEAPVGTLVTVEVSSAESVASGRLVFDSNLPAIDLAKADATGAEAADPSAGPLWRATFAVERSCAYSIELVGSSGFKNLEPPTYPVLAVADRPPSVRVIDPARGDVDVTANGIVPLRVVAEDDFGVAELGVEIKAFGAPSGRSYDLAADPAADPKRRLVQLPVDLAKETFALGDATRSVQAGESLAYRVFAGDNHAVGAEAKPNRTNLTERRIDVVSPSEKLRLLTERQLRSKDEVRAIRTLQQEKLSRLEALLRETEQGGDDLAPVGDEVAALEVGQNQVTTRALKQCREFTDVFQEYLFNRLDESAGAEALVVLVLEARRGSGVVDAFDAKLWRSLVESNAQGALGRLEVLGRLLEMLHCALDVGETHAPAAARALSEARVAVDAASRPALLRAALEEQKRAVARLDQLLEKLDEWENFQEILALFRGLIEDQKDLNQRTRRALNPGAGGDDK